MRLQRILLAAIAALAGCATVEPHLVPAPAIFKDARLAFDATVPVELQSTRLPVFLPPRGPRPEALSTSATTLRR